MKTEQEDLGLTWVGTWEGVNILKMAEQKRKGKMVRGEIASRRLSSHPLDRYPHSHPYLYIHFTIFSLTLSSLLCSTEYSIFSIFSLFLSHLHACFSNPVEPDSLWAYPSIFLISSSCVIEYKKLQNLDQNIHSFFTVLWKHEGWLCLDVQEEGELLKAHVNQSCQVFTIPPSPSYLFTFSWMLLVVGYLCVMFKVSL